MRHDREVAPCYFRTSPTQPGKPDDIAVKVLGMLSPSMLNDHIPLSVLGDGNCMYRTLSRGLFETENHHMHVRLLTALKTRLTCCLILFAISQSPHSRNNDNYMNWPMTM